MGGVENSPYGRREEGYVYMEVWSHYSGISKHKQLFENGLKLPGGCII